MDRFSLDHLRDTEFEQFCYDLLQNLGFSSINWRKGTGLATSPADSGRDLECQLLQRRIDGETYFEKWFVECKHYQKGVPADALTGALAWAAAERPDTLLIIASNFLSNPTKEYLEKYLEKNRPPYKIIFWERPQLEKLTSTCSTLLKKYRISGEYPFLAIMHPTHIACLRDMPLNSFQYFIGCMDELPPEKRDAMFGMAYHAFLQPRSRKPVTGKETIGELLIDRVDYPAFKKRCLEIIHAGRMNEYMLTYLIVSFTLEQLFRLGDTTSIDKAVDRWAEFAELSRRQMEKRPLEREDYEALITDAKQRQKEMPELIKQNYELYIYFCEHVLEKLHREKFLISQKFSEKLSDQNREDYEDFLQFYREKLQEEKSS